MLCPRCHKVVVPGGKFCGSCGADLSYKSGGSHVYPLQTYIVGRSNECHVIFTDLSVSRKHCSVEMLSDGTFFLRDLQSKNGTFVDGIQVKQKHIMPSSKIRLGNLNIAGSDILSLCSSKSPAVNVKPSTGNTLFYIIGGIAAAFLLAFLVLPSKKVDTVQNFPSVSASQHQSLQKSDSIDWMRNAERATVIIFVKLRNGNYLLGSGFFVNRRTIVTNRHVVHNADSISIGNKIIGVYTARLIAVAQGQQRDFAVLDVGRDVVDPLPLSTNVKRNNKIYAWGYPGVLVDRINWNGLPEVVSTSGEINVIRNGATNIIVHSAKVAPGNSGGPLINENGCVVGINTLLLGDKTGLYYISYTSSDIIHFLNEYGIKYIER